MSEGPPEPPEKANQHAWVTHEVLQEFFNDRGVRADCELCGSDSLAVLNAGNDSMVGSLPAYGRRSDGVVDTGNSLHIPVARVMCVNCGNIRIHSLYALDIWRVAKGRIEGPVEVTLER